MLGARALGVVASLQEGYDLLRGEAHEERVVVSDAAAVAYEAMHHEVPRVLQRYGRLGADFR